MIWKKKFEYPKSTRFHLDGKRQYSVNNEKLPSVTTILSATKSEEEKASLKNWRDRVGHIEADKIKRDATYRGSQMHSYLEQFLLGKLNLSFFESNEKYKNMAKEIIDKGIKNKLSEIWGTETTLYYPNKYAGTCDLVGIYNNCEAIIDFKQANKPKKNDYVQDYFLQLGAYTLAHNIVYKSNISLGVILLCTVDNLFQEFKIEGDELLMYQNLFLGRLKKFNDLKNLS